MHHTGADNQPNPIFNSATNTVDAGNWLVTDSWAIPSTATSGVYFAKLTTDTGNFQNMIPFIVRNDGTTSDLLFQTSDTTWKRIIPGAVIICTKVPVAVTAIAPMLSATIVRLP
jgi:hypothetical protein